MRALSFVVLVVVANAGAGCSTTPPTPTVSTAPSEATAPAIAPTIPGAPLLSRAPEPGAFDSARTRDPFEPGITTAPEPATDDVARKAKRFTLDDLKLVAIVGDDGTKRAMLVDPRGKGWVVARGDHVGKPDVTDHLVGWKVERVRDGEVVFVRDDATRSDRDRETRVIALRGAAAPIDFVDD